MRRQDSERGAILIVVISAVAMITVMGLLLLGMVSYYQQRIANKAERSKARYLAEAGVYRSIWELHYTRYDPNRTRDGVKCDGNVDVKWSGPPRKMEGGEANAIPFYDNRENTDLKQQNNPRATYGYFGVEYDYREGSIKSTGDYNGTKHSYVVKIEQN